MTLWQVVAAGGNYPATKLLGTSPKGFGASGDYESENYHEFLETLQEFGASPMVERHHKLVNRAYIKPMYGREFGVIHSWN